MIRSPNTQDPTKCNILKNSKICKIIKNLGDLLLHHLNYPNWFVDHRLHRLELLLKTDFYHEPRHHNFGYRMTTILLVLTVDRFVLRCFHIIRCYPQQSERKIGWYQCCIPGIFAKRTHLAYSENWNWNFTDLLFNRSISS